MKRVDLDVLISRQDPHISCLLELGPHRYHQKQHTYCGSKCVYADHIYLILTTHSSEIHRLVQNLCTEYAS